MFKKLHAFLLSRGMTLMVIGFAIAATGLLAYIYNLNNLHSAMFARVAHAATFSGFGIYVIGRIYVVIKRRQDKSTTGQRQPLAEDEAL